MLLFTIIKLLTLRLSHLTVSLQFRLVQHVYGVKYRMKTQFLHVEDETKQHLSNKMQEIGSEKNATVSDRPPVVACRKSVTSAQ